MSLLRRYILAKRIPSPVFVAPVVWLKFARRGYERFYRAFSTYRFRWQLVNPRRHFLVTSGNFFIAFTDSVVHNCWLLYELIQHRLSIVNLRTNSLKFPILPHSSRQWWQDDGLVDLHGLSHLPSSTTFFASLPLADRGSTDGTNREIICTVNNCYPEHQPSHEVIAQWAELFWNVLLLL